MNLTEATEKLKLKIQDDAEKLSVDDQQNTIVNSLELFSKDFSRIITDDISGDGNYDYTPPSDWLDGFSVIKKIEYPAGERIPRYIDEDDWTIYDDTSSKKIRFLSHTPASGETVRITFTVPYYKATIVNIPINHIDAFIHLCAANACMSIATKMGFVQTPTIQADSVNYHSKGGEFAKRSKEFKKLYDDFIGKSEGVLAASTVMDWDSIPSWQSDHLTHEWRFN